MAAFGMYAFVYIMMNGSDSSPTAVTSMGGSNLMSLQEFDGIPNEIKKIYEKTVIDIIAPAIREEVKTAWANLLKEKTLAEIELEAEASAKEFVFSMKGSARAEGFADPTKPKAFLKKLSEKCGVYEAF
jgi:hypothetical protein